MSVSAALVIPAAAVLLMARAAPCAAPADVLERAPSRFAREGGVKVHYKSIGEGREAVVFVHGWSCNLDFWRFQAPALADRARALYVDLPGHGRSDKPETAYTMDLFARSVEAVMRDAGVRGAVLVGHSNGTPVIRQFYRLFPGKTRALVVVDGSLRPFWKERSELDSFVSTFKGADYKEKVAKFVEAITATTAPELREWIKAAMLQTPQRVMVSSFEETGHPGLWKTDSITVPVLMVLAKQPFWTADYEAFVRGLAPRVDYRVMEGVSHFLMMDEPGEFNAILGGFVADQGLLKK